MVDWLYSWGGIITLSVVGLVIGTIAAVIWSFRQPDPNPKKPRQLNINSPALLSVGLALVGLFAQVPSISVDLSTIFSYASQIVTMMMPIVGVGAGISFGFALVAYIIRLFRQVF